MQFNAVQQAIFKAFETNIGTFFWLLTAAIAATVLGLIFSIIGPRIKGAIGEKAVKKALDGLGVEHLNDVYLPYEGGVTQIDHIALAGSTILVIETKNYDGAVYGNEKDANWTVAYNKQSKQRIQSPLRQNYAHMLAVKAVVGADLEVRGAVVFMGDSKFPNGMPTGVYKLPDLKNAAVDLSRRGRSEAAQAAWESIKTRLSLQSIDGLKAAHKASIKRRREPKAGFRDQ